MNNFSIFLAVMLLLIPYLVFADISCQYKDIETYNETEQFLVDKSNNFQGNPPKFSDFITEKNNITSFIINNPNPFKILVHLNLTIEGFGGGGKYYGVDIKSLQNRKVEELCYDNDKSGYCFINESSITYFVSTPDSPDLSILYPKNLTLTKTKLVCKLCNNAPCLDDGAECSINEECGGEFCVEKICNNKPECFVDNCKCERFNKTQCKNNRCVSKNVLPEGDRPFCGPLECTTNYTDNSGRCAKSPAQKDAEAEEKAKNNSRRVRITLILSIIVIIAIIGLAIYFNKKNTKKREAKARKKAREAAEKEYEEAKKEQGQSRNDYLKKMNLLIQNIRVQEEALEDKKKQLSESKNMLNEAENNLVKTKQIREKKESEMKEIVEMEKNISESKAKLKDLTKPKHSLTRGFWEWQNPEKNYYPCYWNGEGKNNNIEIHKDLAEKEIFNFYRKWFNKYYPGKNFNDFVVHHIDKDISNYELANLAIISHDEHEKLHKKSQQKNWLSGIEELKEHGIKQPHIDELGGQSITDPYEILGVSRNASKEDIKLAYHKLASKNHPDKVNHLDKQFQILADSRFKKINEAYHKLID